MRARHWVPGRCLVGDRVLSSLRTRLFWFLLFFAAALSPGVVDNVDSRIVMRTATQLLDAGTWSLGDVGGTYMASPEYGAIGVDDQFQMKFGAGNAVIALPFLVVGRTVLAPLGLGPERGGEGALALASALWFALTGVVLNRILRRFLDHRAAMLATLVYAVASYAVVYSRSSYLETPLTLAVLFAYERALWCRESDGGARPGLWLGFACAAVLWLKLAAATLLLGLPFVLVFGGARGTVSAKDAVIRTLRKAVLTFVPMMFLLGVVNNARFGDPFTTGYGGSARFDHSFVDGVMELLFSDRGLLFHAPISLLGLASLPVLARRDQGLAWGIGLSCLAATSLYAPFFSPFGGDAWGPRYLLPNVALLSIPAGIALSKMLRAGSFPRAVAAGLIAASLALQIAPCALGFSAFWSQRSRGADELAPAPTVARMALLKVTTKDGLWNPADVGLHAAPGELPGTRILVPHWDLAPVRVAKDLPAHRTLAWAAWSLLLCLAAVSFAALLSPLRRDAQTGGAS